MRHCGTQILQTGRLTLRPLSIHDAEMMFGNWASDPRVAKYLRWQPHRSWAETAEYLNEVSKHYTEPDFYQWGIEEKVSGALIGSISLARGEADPGWPPACERLGEIWEPGYCLGRKWWGRGYATEGLRHRGALRRAGLLVWPCARQMAVLLPCQRERRFRRGDAESRLHLPSRRHLSQI